MYLFLYYCIQDHSNWHHRYSKRFKYYCLKPAENILNQFERRVRLILSRLRRWDSAFFSRIREGLAQIHHSFDRCWMSPIPFSWLWWTDWCLQGPGCFQLNLPLCRGPVSNCNVRTEWQRQSVSFRNAPEIYVDCACDLWPLRSRQRPGDGIKRHVPNFLCGCLLFFLRWWGCELRGFPSHESSMKFWVQNNINDFRVLRIWKIICKHSLFAPHGNPRFTVQRRDHIGRYSNEKSAPLL